MADISDTDSDSSASISDSSEWPESSVRNLHDSDPDDSDSDSDSLSSSSSIDSHDEPLGHNRIEVDLTDESDEDDHDLDLDDISDLDGADGADLDALGNDDFDMDDGFGGVNIGYDDDHEDLFVAEGDWMDYSDGEDHFVDNLDDLHQHVLHHNALHRALEEINRNLDDEMDDMDEGRRNSLFDTPPPGNLLNQVQGGQDGPDRQRQLRDELVQVEVAGQARAGAGQRRPAPATVIDLTGDDDDDVVQHRQTAAQRASANTRRRRSQQQNAPRLNRSDANYVGDQDIIIISDSEDELAPRPRGRNVNNINNNNRNLHRHIHHHHHHHNGFGIPRGPRNPARPPPAMADQDPNDFEGHFDGHLHRLIHRIPFFRAMGRPAAPPVAANRPLPEDELVITGERNLGQPRPAAMNIDNPLPQTFMLGGLNYMAVPFPDPLHFAPPAADRARAPKPQHVPPKAARPGFTRDTGEELVAVCPSCEQELAYDPDADHSADTPTKSGKAKKNQREHHFWAVKACGHVYCKKCFDNRAKRAGSKSLGKNQVVTGFQHPPDSKKTLCAVEDCETDVTQKSAWVGIFL
ncbi:hypothetical protein GGR57DRAFT_505173 [Xylariaceae sp. FL1272]|nr:hypothetical protein GGR57DRAFT_505173 [Xylariaceae sp. FL1272]